MSGCTDLTFRLPMGVRWVQDLVGYHHRQRWISVGYTSTQSVPEKQAPRLHLMIRPSIPTNLLIRQCFPAQHQRRNPEGDQERTHNGDQHQPW